MIRKIFGGSLFILGTCLGLLGCAAIDSNSVIPLAIIAGGLTIGTIGYKMMGIKRW